LFIIKRSTYREDVFVGSQVTVTTSGESFVGSDDLENFDGFRQDGVHGVRRWNLGISHHVLVAQNTNDEGNEGNEIRERKHVSCRGSFFLNK
jgi:hypothetical protein